MTSSVKRAPLPAERLDHLERIIQKGKKSFIAVGEALSEIRSSRLYKEQYSTFEEYCRERWGWKRAHCNQLIAGAEAVKALPPELDTIVSNQGQARALAAVAPERRAEVLQVAATANGGEVTAKAIAEAAKPKREPDPEPELHPERCPLTGPLMEVLPVICKLAQGLGGLTPTELCTIEEACYKLTCALQALESAVREAKPYRKEAA